MPNFVEFLSVALLLAAALSGLARAGISFGKAAHIWVSLFERLRKRRR